MPNPKTNAKSTRSIAEVLDQISELVGKIEVFEAHGQLGRVRVQLQELLAEAKAAV